MASSARLWLTVAVALAVGSSACRSHVGFREQYLKSRSELVSGNWDTAVEQFVATKDELFGERDRVMYWLNLGTLQHYAGRYSASQQTFIKAEKAIQDLFTKSVTAEASKYTISETLSPYEGEDFEKILLYYYTALNNVAQGKLTDAIVEARRADEFLKKIQVKYENDEKLSTIYTEDAFMLWMVGLFYEIEGSYPDAFLAYKRSFKVYNKLYRSKFGTRPPSYLAEDIVRTGMMASQENEALQRFAERSGAKGDTVENVQNKAEVIVIHANGEAPFKKQMTFTAPAPDGYIVRVALPQFQATKAQVVRTQVRIGGRSYRPEMAEPVTSIALQSFKHQLPAIKARATVRAIAKYVATKGTQKLVSGGSDSSSARKIAGALIGLFGNIASAASEKCRPSRLDPAAFGLLGHPNLGGARSPNRRGQLFQSVRGRGCRPPGLRCRPGRGPAQADQRPNRALTGGRDGRSRVFRPSRGASRD